MDELDKLRLEHRGKVDSDSQYGQHVPSSYFDELENKILDKVRYLETEPKIETKSGRKIYNLLKYSGAVAALLLLFFGISKFDSSAIENTAYSELSASEQVDYLMGSEEFYAEDLLEIDGIDEVLSELEEQYKNK